MAYQCLTLERAAGVATLTLNRPDAYNALNLPLGRELFAASLELDEDPDVRCIVVTGSGRAFCAGGDVKDFVENLGRIGVHIKELTTYLHGAISRFCRSDKPVIMAVNGVAAGGGFSLAMAGDMIVAARSANFIQVFSRIGLVPDLGSTWLLPRLIGRQRALELMLFNEPLSAERAREWGLVREVVDDAQLMDAAIQLAQRLAQGPTRALVATRMLLEESEHATYAAQFRREIEVQSEVRHSADALEGRAAFVEKRKASFSGR
jgi:2-(1,2-epoxy-1,2-dihydrophenyl)acetyl-CoA isomerase